MKKDDHNNLTIILIVVWIMLSTFEQCASTEATRDIYNELRNIRHELNMMRYR